jgi:DNA-binding LytR/AlgR family response regulator
MKVLVIENEESTAQKIKDLLTRLHASIREEGVTEDVSHTVEWVKNNSEPDIILVNKSITAELEQRAGRTIKATVIFSTATEELRMRAYRYKTLRQFINGFSHPPQHTENSNGKGKQPSLSAGAFRERFLVKQGQKLLSVSIDQIAYFFSEERFIFFRTMDGQKFIVEYRIEQLEDLLPPSKFFRVNRSFIVSHPSVKEIHAWFGHRLKLFLHPLPDKTVIVSRKRVSAFKAWLGK